MTKTIFVRGTFEGFHKWNDAPPEVHFLKHLHRHLFHYEVHCTVSHNDRQVEFFMLKTDVDNYFEETGDIYDSCEQIAEDLMNWLWEDGYSIPKVIISEDNENGAIICTG